MGKRHKQLLVDYDSSFEEDRKPDIASMAVRAPVASANNSARPENLHAAPLHSMTSSDQAECSRKNYPTTVKEEPQEWPGNTTEQNKSKLPAAVKTEPDVHSNGNEHFGQSSRRTKMLELCISMGFSPESAEQAIDFCGDEDPSAVLDHLLTLEHVMDSCENQNAIAQHIQQEIAKKSKGKEKISDHAGEKADLKHDDSIRREKNSAYSDGNMHILDSCSNYSTIAQHIQGETAESSKGKENIADHAGEGGNLKHDDNSRAYSDEDMSPSLVFRPAKRKKVLELCLSMGFSPESTRQAIDSCGVEDPGELLDHILTLEHVRTTGEAKESKGEHEAIKRFNGKKVALNLESQLDLSDHVDTDGNSDSSYSSTPSDEDRGKFDNTSDQLLSMGFSRELVMQAVESCGDDASLHTLMEFIFQQNSSAGVAQSSKPDTFLRLQSMGFSATAAERASSVCGDVDDNILIDYMVALEFHNTGTAKKSKDASIVQNKMDLDDIWKELETGSSSDLDSSSEDEENLKRHKQPHNKLKKQKYNLPLMRQTKHLPCQGRLMGLMGYGLPGQVCKPRMLDQSISGPPYFYFENVASMPKGEWEKISRFFDSVEPEFVDSKYFSACRRPRGYIHNLPLEGRELVLPKPLMTIQELFPNYVQYWPAWDKRTKLHCFSTRTGPSMSCKKVQDICESYKDTEPPEHRLKEIRKECARWNLVWVGPYQVAPLEPNEMEICLGFDIGHTRGALTKTERVQSLGNSFQIHTVAFHLSVLRYLYPDGIRVLSLFSGIGGAEVALDKLGIPLKYLVSVEKEEKNRMVIESWWRKTQQKGCLQLKEDVTHLTKDVLSKLIDETGGFDLIIGGSPCNNLSGNNRVSRVGLEGEKSCVFYEFPRILNTIKQLMQAKRQRNHVA